MKLGLPHPRPLGQLLVEWGLISQDQLEAALVEQGSSRKRLGTILVDNGIVTSGDLASALQAQVGEVAGQCEVAVIPTAAGEQGAKRRRLFLRRGADDDTGVPREQVRELLQITETQNAELRSDLARLDAELDLARSELARHESRVAELEAQLSATREERSSVAHALQAVIRELDKDLRTLRTGR